MATLSPDKTPNIAEPEAYCHRCANTGWVELAGTVHVLGTVYTMGYTACKWCEQGTRRYQRAVGPPKSKSDAHRRWQPVSDFSEDEIIPAGFEQERSVKPAEPLIPQLPGMDDTVTIDLEAGARSAYAAWRRALGKELADARLRARTGPDGEPLDRRVYPLEVVELVIAEADALELPATAAPDLEEPL